MVLQLHYVLFQTPFRILMPEPPLALPDPVLTDVENHIQNTISSGTHIRSVLAGHSNKGPWNTIGKLMLLLRHYTFLEADGRLKSSRHCILQVQEDSTN